MRDMKKRWKRRVLTAIVAVASIAAVVAIAYLSPMLFMNPASTGAVYRTTILALNNGLNSLYFVPAEDGEMLVHPYTMDRKAAESSIERIAAAVSGTGAVLTAHYRWYEPGALYYSKSGNR